MKHVIVIGCGLAGLAAAIAIRRGGHTVEIVEQAPELSYIGAGKYFTQYIMCLCSPSSIVGIQVSSNSSLILRKLGVDKYILPFTTEPVDLKMMRWQDGKVLVQCPLKKPALEEYGSPYWHIHRADLHRGLLECATDLGITLHLDSKVLDVDLDYGSLVTSKGEKLTADFIVASDGRVLFHIFYLEFS